LKERRHAELGKNSDVAHEVRLLSSVSHPNIVEFLGSFVDSNTGFLVMVLEYAEKGDLHHFLREKANARQSLSKDEIWKLFIPVCEAVSYLHSQNIIHRDIKPLNVFLFANGVVKVGDLGIGRQLSNQTLLCNTQGVGSPMYLSPELCENRPYNNKTDVWALGVLLYELCELKPPFVGRNIVELTSLICKGSVAPMSSHTSQQLRDTVKSFLTRDMHRRPTIASFLKWYHKMQYKHKHAAVSVPTPSVGKELDLREGNRTDGAAEAVEVAANGKDQETERKKKTEIKRQPIPLLANAANQVNALVKEEKSSHPLVARHSKLQLNRVPQRPGLRVIPVIHGQHAVDGARAGETVKKHGARERGSNVEANEGKAGQAAEAVTTRKEEENEEELKLKLKLKLKNERRLKLGSPQQEQPPAAAAPAAAPQPCHHQPKERSPVVGGWKQVEQPSWYERKGSFTSSQTQVSRPQTAPIPTERGPVVLDRNKRWEERLQNHLEHQTHRKVKQQDKGRGNANEEGRVQEDAKRKEKGKNKPQGPTVVAVVEEEEEEEEVKEWIPIQHVHHKPTPRALHHLERRVQYQPLVESNFPIHGGHGGGGGDDDVDGGGSSNRHGRVNQVQRQGSGRVRVLDPSMVPPLHQPREGEFVHQMGIQRQILRYRSMLSPSSSREGDKGHGWEDEFSLRDGATSPDGTGAGGVTERSNDDDDADDGLIATDSEGEEEEEEEEEEKDVLPPTHRQRATPRGGIFNIIACAWD
jgi:hypothetical protein